ncbi:MAG TPA: sigma-70 family RNA polymerase sigma factor [Polyangiaceae bacterium]|jgi:RNA polymerase sigma-70 factor (ECF subfamily)
MDSDEALYARVKHGDIRAFDELYARYATRLFGFLRPQLPGRPDAEDVFHEAMMATLESDEVAFDRGSFRTWLYRIARNLVLNRLRSRGRGEHALLKLGAADDEPAPPADDRVAHGQLLRALDGAVARLPSPLSDVYHLRSSGLSYEEMATVLGIPLGTLKSRMNQMVNVLREELKPWTTAR